MKSQRFTAPVEDGSSKSPTTILHKELLPKQKLGCMATDYKKNLLSLQISTTIYFVCKIKVKSYFMFL